MAHTRVRTDRESVSARSDEVTKTSSILLMICREQSDETNTEIWSSMDICLVLTHTTKVSLAIQLITNINKHITA